MKVIDHNFIFIDTDFQTQKEVFAFLAEQVFSSKRGNDLEKIVEGFYEREQEFSTAMDNYIAIPHCRNESILQATVIVVRNKSEIKWTDNEDVKLIFALLVPGSNENQMHIRILAQVAQLIMEEDFIDLVNKAKGDDQIYQRLSVLNHLQEG